MFRNQLVHCCLLLVAGVCDVRHIWSVGRRYNKFSDLNKYEYEAEEIGRNNNNANDIV